MADELHYLINELEARPTHERVRPQSAYAGPGRTPARFIRTERQERFGRLHVFVGRALWYDIGSPQRLGVQWVGGQLELRGANGDQG